MKKKYLLVLIPQRKLILVYFQSAFSGEVQIFC